MAGRRLALIVVAALAAACSTLAASDDPAELARTWEHAWVAVPPGGPRAADAPRRLGEPDTARLLAALPPGTRLPAIVYLHGCTGLSPVTRHDMARLARAGYAVIAPDSFARRYRPSNCDQVGHSGGTFPLAGEFRHAEIRYAAARVRELPWVDRRRVILMGFSEGGIAVAAYDGDEYAAHVITGWTCQAPSDSGLAAGIWAPRGKPVLAIVASADPWFRWPEFRGHCGQGGARAGLESVVVDAAEHHVTWYPAAERALLAFLRRHTPAAR